jgi:hypothetical protein
MIDPRAGLLVAVCLLLVALIASQFYTGVESDSAPSSVSARADEGRAIPRPVQPPADELIAVALARPLFNSARRPPDSGQGTSSEFRDKRLAGIVIEPDKRVALFAVIGAKPLMLAEGDTIDGWRIESIAATEISLVGPAGTRTLEPTLAPAAVRTTESPRNITPRNPAQSQQRAAGQAPPHPQQAAGAQSAPPRSPQLRQPSPRPPIPPARAPVAQARPQAAPNPVRPEQGSLEGQPNSHPATNPAARPVQRP